MARLLDGKGLADQLRAELASDIEKLTATAARPPKLVAVLVGEDPASQVYVRNKEAACRKAGIASEVRRLPGSTTEAELIGVVDSLNADATVDGILVQLPLPPQIDPNAVIDRIEPTKDVDGFHPDNAGRLAVGRPRFIPCTPLGVRTMLERAGIETRGKHAVVLGRSNIVGKPMALLLLEKGIAGDATVTVAHSASQGLPELCRSADILIAAVGRPEMVRGDWIKPGAVVVDVGIHRKADGTLCGDVAFAEAEAHASAISPVPGGVGPMTIAMLLQNTYRARLMHNA